MKWLGWLGWSIDHTVPSSLLVAWIIHSSVVRRDLFQETFFWKPTSYVDAYRKEKGPLTVFFWKQIVHQKIPALQIAFFPPPAGAKPWLKLVVSPRSEVQPCRLPKPAFADIMGCSSGSLTQPMPMATPMPSRGGNFGKEIFWATKRWLYRFWGFKKLDFL